MNRAVPLLQDFLAESARRLPDKIALVAGDVRLTYGELARRVRSLAATFVRRGISRGDRVLVFADNGPEAVVAFWAALEANAVVSMISPQTKADKLAYMLADSGAKALVTQAKLAPVFRAAAARAPELAITIVAGDPNGGWDEAIARDPDGSAPRACIDVDLAAIVYTSGSTGDPKGVMLTHRNMMTASTSITTYLDNREDDVILGVLPLAFDYGLYQMIMAFQMGARLVLEKSFAFPPDVLSRVVREGVTGFPGVPTMFAMLAEMDGLAAWDFSKIRYVTNTAAALPVKHITMLRELFPNARIHSMYGLTECKRCTHLPPEDLERKPTSVGVAIPNTELWIVDERDRRLGPHEVGQLVIRGATVMAGYWGKPDETAKKLRAGPVPGERVLYTGDYCRLDDDGYLYFVGRMDDIIKSRGEKVAPKEVEGAIVDVRGVKEAAVVGVPDPILGQAVKAFVVLERGVSIEAKDIERECRSRLESFMVPKHVVFVEELPKTTTGKINKSGLA
ncbi:MAG TPA: AMP-binding protein [Polyangiaceae bacterium]|jgi:amino acid adenylation domain-containing protein